MHSARFEIVCKRFCLPPLNSLLIPYRRPTHPCSPCSVAFLPLTIPQLTPLQSLSYSVQTSDLLPFNRFLTPLMTPIQSHFYPLAIPQLTPLQLHFYPLTNVRLTPLQSLSYSLTIVRLTLYNRLTYPPSNALLIPYKPWPYSRSIDCLSRNNVRLIPLQFHTKVQIYPH